MLLLLGGCVTNVTPGPIPAYQESPYRDLDTLQEGVILHVPTGIEVTQAQLLDFLGSARIVYVGETHSNLLHHQVQLTILQELSKRFPGRIAVGMEMLDLPVQPVLDRWSRGEMDEKSFMKVWYDNWSQDYDYYKDILRFIRQNQIPLIALNAPDEQVRELSEKGAEGLSEAARKNLPDLDPTDPYHRESMKAIIGGHGHGQKGFEQFYQTMLLWDETMAQTIARYLSSDEGQGKKMIVLAGGFHVGYGFGIPRRVFRRLHEPYAIVLPHTTRIPKGKEYLLMDVTPPKLPLYLADFVWGVGYDDLEEKRVRLGIEIERSEKGVAVRAVAPGSVAAKAGLQTGDVIASFGGEPTMDPFDLTYLVKQQRPGDRSTLKILRKDRTLELEVHF
jgi:uncharacterized iron-regulated protein